MVSNLRVDIIEWPHGSETTYVGNDRPRLARSIGELLPSLRWTVDGVVCSSSLRATREDTRALSVLLAGNIVTAFRWADDEEVHPRGGPALSWTMLSQHSAHAESHSVNVSSALLHLDIAEYNNTSRLLMLPASKFLCIGLRLPVTT